MGSLLLALAAGDVWVTLTTASLDETATVAEQLDARASLADPVMMAEQLPAAAESGGVPFVAGLCLLFIAGATELLSLLVPATRPAATADTPTGRSSFQLSR